MFDRSPEQSEREADDTGTDARRRFWNVLVILLSMALFGGLYAALRFMES